MKKIHAIEDKDGKFVGFIEYTNSRELVERTPEGHKPYGHSIKSTTKENGKKIYEMVS